MCEGIYRMYSTKATSLYGFILLAATFFGLAGCSRQQSASQALDVAMKNAGVTKEAVFPFSGHILIDGQPPQLGPRESLFIMLNEPGKFSVPSIQKRNIRMNASQAGEFEFTTYAKGDGVPPGKYVVTFAILTKKGKAGFFGPDKLKNLFNDPDVNSKNEAFTIDHQTAKTDYQFFLDVAGKESASAGPNALKELVEKRR